MLIRHNILITGFQFLIGRLKTSCFQFIFLLSFLFQFLIGRLKTGCYLVDGYFVSYVSIPYR